MTHSPSTRSLGALALLLALTGCEADSVTGTSACVSTTAVATATTKGTADVAAVVAAVNAFKATLTAAQLSTVQLDLTTGNADNWSNLPVGGMTSRNGLRFDALTDAQRTAALAVVQAALSSKGYGTFNGIRAADQYLSQNGGGSQYGQNLYLIAFLGTPSTTGKWILQFGGHHYAVNFGYQGSTASPTPFFMGVEPLSFTLSGTTYAPMRERAATSTAIFDALSSTELASAQLSTTFGDVLLGPGQDFAFPTQVGLRVGTLSSDKQALVVNAIRAWAEDADTGTAADLIAAYTSADALANTTIAWSSSNDLTAQRSYIRIDGPRVWIEIVAQNGVVLSGIHYHSIWRDKTLDYGGVFSTTTGTEDGPC